MCGGFDTRATAGRARAARTIIILKAVTTWKVIFQAERVHHAPKVRARSTSTSGTSTENERNQKELRIVASCGQARPYVYWTVLDGEYVVDSRAGVASEYAIGETLPFCPPGRFYNENKAGCGLNRDLSEFAQENDLVQGFDELTQQQLDSCCVRCEDCEVDITRKGPDYVECSGATLSDTQKNQCVRKCPFGTHESNQTCVRCQECFVGESLSRN